MFRKSSHAASEMEHGMDMLAVQNEHMQRRLDALERHVALLDKIVTNAMPTANGNVVATANDAGSGAGSNGCVAIDAGSDAEVAQSSTHARASPSSALATSIRLQRTAV